MAKYSNLSGWFINGRQKPKPKKKQEAFLFNGNVCVSKKSLEKSLSKIRG